MSRRTHYIPVGNLVLDGVSIDPEIYCPANGYPDPTAPETLAQYCPAGGYYDPTLPIPYTPPHDIPVMPNEGEIVLIMTTAYDAAINTTVGISDSTKSKYTIYGADDNVIHTQEVNNNTVFFYQFPSTGGVDMGNGLFAFKVVITAATTGSITSFKFSTKTYYAPSGWPVLEAYIKCPSLISLSEGFYNQKYLKKVEFSGNHNALTSLYRICSGCATLEYFNANVEMNELQNFDSALQNTPMAEQVLLPASMNKVTSIFLAFYNCGIKSSPPLPESLPLCTNATQAFFGMSRMKGTLYVPDMPNCTAIGNLASGCTLLEKIVFLGSVAPNNSTTLSLASGCENLIEVDMGLSWGSVGVNYSLSSFLVNTPMLKKLVMPSYMKGTITSPWSSVGGDFITEMTTADWTDMVFSGQFSFFFRKLTHFNQPTLRITGTFITQFSSGNPGSLEYVEIDWANSSLSILTLRYNNLSDTEINRIFTALPAGTANIDVRNNPGRNTCDITIATSKGYTVL